MKGLVIHRKILTLSFVTLLLLVTSAWCQSQDQDQDSENSQDSVTGSDPNLVNPQKNQGYGRNSQSQLLPPAKTTRSSKPAPPVETSTVAEQSVQAILQFGVLVGVALLCGILFFMLIGFEKMCDCVKDKLVSVFGKEKILEPEDPAALVGTFKRYK